MLVLFRVLNDDFGTHLKILPLRFEAKFQENQCFDILVCSILHHAIDFVLENLGV